MNICDRRRNNDCLTKQHHLYDIDNLQNSITDITFIMQKKKTASVTSEITITQNMTSQVPSISSFDETSLVLPQSHTKAISKPRPSREHKAMAQVSTSIFYVIGNFQHTISISEYCMKVSNHS
jgi:hypothetical protein